jgi:hypothetical protein
MRFAMLLLLALPAFSQKSAPLIPFDPDPNFLKLNYQMNLGEVLGVAVNSKGTVVVLNHPGSATSGPLYGNATTQLLEFDSTGKFVRELGKGVYGLGYAHGVRFDKYDNLWVVDKGTHAAMRFNPVLRTFAERLKKAGNSAKLIIVACMRKLLTLTAICFATGRASSRGMAPRARRWARSSPSTSSITRASAFPSGLSRPSCPSSPYTCAMFG